MYPNLFGLEYITTPEAVAVGGDGALAWFEWEKTLTEELMQKIVSISVRNSSFDLFMAMDSGVKKSYGRQKIEMKKMSNESNLQVTFSKRRSGLFKKASELCTLCGAEVALVVFSPGEKVFSFGHPNVEAVIDRYLARAPPHDLGTMQFIEAHRLAHVRELNAQLTQINAQLEAVRQRGEELNGMKKDAQAQMWWAQSIEKMSPAQLEQYKTALEDLKKLVARLADRAMLQSATNQGHQFFPGAPSSSNLVHQPHPPQLFPPPLMQPPMFQNFMFPDGSMVSHHGFNHMGMGGYAPGPGPGPAGGFF
ncbi:unnamed protein product [Sphenostylis stenocarpa]|uniref:MADS-box domain-containing protein n=1 Tax=Sphenostylis stenocarpa TaxID=92480 RepID=A0AA86W3C1_9FABA|nr:unnamed protein product [Sphenostylis stenocarpa]